MSEKVEMFHMRLRFDPEKENPPGEATGASKCALVDENDELVDTFNCKQCGAMKEAFKDYQR